MDKRNKDKDLEKKGSEDKSFKKNQNQKGRMKKNGQKEDFEIDHKIGSGSAGISGTSGI